MKGVEHGVFFGNFTCIQGLFCKLHGVCNVLVVVLSSKKSSTRFGFRMRPFDLNAPHSPFISPQALNNRVVEKCLKAEKTQRHQFIMVPFLEPFGLSLQMRVWNRRRAVVVDDELVVRRDTNIKLNSIEHVDGMTKTFQGIFRRWRPRFLRCHGSPFLRPSSKVPAPRC